MVISLINIDNLMKIKFAFFAQIKKRNGIKHFFWEETLDTV
jgi:hypothetical protein